MRPVSWVRMMKAAYATTPLGTGSGSSRFSSPSGSFQVLYMGQSVGTALAETVIRDRFESLLPDARTLPRAELARWVMTEINATRELRLVDLRHDGPLRLGLDTDAVGAKAHTSGQVFSQEIHDAFPRIDGLLYLSRLNRGQCIALYDRSITSTLTASPPVAIERSTLVEHALETFRIALLDDPS
jgi:hypothetical protein